MRLNTVLVALLLLSGGPVVAQSDTPAPVPKRQQPAAGSGTAKPSPELRQARKAARQACSPDIRSLCASAEPGGGKVMMCIRSHRDQVSKDCQAALIHLRDLRRGA